MLDKEGPRTLIASLLFLGNQIFRLSCKLQENDFLVNYQTERKGTKKNLRNLDQQLTRHKHNKQISHIMQSESYDCLSQNIKANGLNMMNFDK